MGRKEVMEAIERENKVYSIRITGNEKNKSDGFYILMNTQHLISDEREVFHGIKSNTLKLLREAEIKFDVID